MSGIPVYTSSPINASKASGTTPQTSLPPSSAATYTPATATATSSLSYPPAQPGTAAFPAPTGAAQKYAPQLQPTPTTKPDYGPAAPQPGAVPTPASRSAILPPPKAGESYHPPPSISAPMQLPPQMGIPPHTSIYRAQPPASATSTSTTASIAYPVSISSAEAAARNSLEHPPGYHQNVHASDLTSEQRRAREANESALDTANNADGLESEGVWNTAKKWAATAGEKLSSAEAEVWRRVSKE